MYTEAEIHQAIKQPSGTQTARIIFELQQQLNELQVQVANMAMILAEKL